MNYYSVFGIDPHTWRIEDCFRSYMYLLEGADRAALLDTGIGLPGLEACIRKITGKPVIVINSHGHLDHVGGNCQFKTCYMMEADREVLREHTQRTFREKMMAGFAEEFGFALEESRLDEMAKAGWEVSFRPLADGQIFELGGRSLEIIASPGHTGGSVCLLDRERRNLFSADTVCDQGVLLFFPHSAPVEDYLRSIKTLERRHEEYDRIWPGHHTCPLEQSFLKAYEDCAVKILEHPEEGEAICSNLGEGRIQNLGRISIAYRMDHLFTAHSG